MSENSLFSVTSITLDGAALAFESGSATIEGASRYEATVVTAGTGADGESMRRVPCTISVNLLLKPGVDPSKLSQARDVRIVLKDRFGPRRVIATKCGFASMGPIGNGPVQARYNVLEELQWVT